MDGIFSMFWSIFGLMLSLCLFVGVGILVLKYLVVFGMKSADEVQLAWDNIQNGVRRGRPKGSKNGNNKDDEKQVQE